MNTSPTPFLIKGFILIGLTVGGFGGWAATAPLDSAAVAPGSIVVDGGRQKIQHLEGGTITELMVRDGDTVKRGQVLLRLDPTQAKASRDAIAVNFIAAWAQETRVLSELRDDTEVAFGKELIANSKRADVRKILNVQRELFEGRSSLRRRQAEILETQISQFENEITALKAERKSKSRQMDLLTEELTGLRTLLADGLTAKARVLQLERNHESLRGDKLSISAKIAKTKNQISELHAKAALEKGKIQDQLNEELKEAQLKVLQAKEQLVGADDVLQRIDIRSPAGGVIASNNIVTQGGVVKPGELIMEVVPNEKSLVINARVSIQDVDSIKVGQKASVLLTAFNQANTPTLTGEVDHVSADRQVDPVTNEPFFEAKIIVPDDQLARLDENQKLKPGMPADAIIVTGERTMLQYLVKPIAESLARSWREE